MGGWRGLDWPGLAWPELAWLGCKPGLAWLGFALHGLEMAGVSWARLARPDIGWPILDWAGMGKAHLAWLETASDGRARHGLA